MFGYHRIWALGKRFSILYLCYTPSTMQRPTITTNPIPNPIPSVNPNPILYLYELQHTCCRWNRKLK